MTSPLLLVLALGAPAPQEPAAEGPSFHHDVRPVLQARCQGCHQPARALGGVDLTSVAAIRRGGDTGALLVPGDPDASTLYDVLLPFGEQPPDMPADGPPLGEDEVALFRDWIAGGAVDDTPEALLAPVDADHPPVYARPAVVTSLDWSPDGELIAASGHHEVLLHSADGSELRGRLIGLAERIQSLAFSPDGTMLAVAGGSPARFGEVQVWDVAERALLLSVSVTYDTLYGVSWSPDGSRVAFGGADTVVRVIDVPSGEEVLYQNAHDDWVLGTTWSTDASHLVSVGRDRSMKLYKVETSQFIDNITSITPGALKGGLMSVDRHPTKDELLVAGSDGVPRHFRMYREKKRVIGDDYNLIRAFDGLPGRAYGVTWSPEGLRIAACSSAGRSGSLLLAEAVEGKTMWQVDLPAAAFSLDFHPAGDRLAVGTGDGHVRVFAAADGAPLLDFVPAPIEPATLAADTQP